MTTEFEHLKQWIADMALLFDKNEDPSPEHYTYFIHDPELSLGVVDLIDEMDETHVDDERAYYSSCVFALDVCVAQLQAATEGGNKQAAKVLDRLMASLAAVIATKKHSLSFWLPILNAFYEVHVELSSELKAAYLDLASDDDELTPSEEANHLNSIRDLIIDLSDLSAFDIAENFFAQSYAMPPEFFADLVLDLYSIEEGQDIALLLLLHPKREVRDVVVATMDQIIESITLSSISLSRLQSITNWFPKAYLEPFNRWIKIQRKKGVVFSHEVASPAIEIKATEVDGSGAQGLFICLKKNRKQRLCGLLLKQGIGIKEAWITPLISARDIKRYYEEAFDDSVMLRSVDVSYLQTITDHFLAVMIQNGGLPDLHLLEMQEELGLQWRPRLIDVDSFMEELGVQISPFTPERMEESLQRSKTWTKNKPFTESWYVENSSIDKLVNRCSSFIDGVKVCRFEEAMNVVFKEEMEAHRDRWLFHFLWTALWMKSYARKNEKIWQDSFLIAHAIHTGVPLADIPIMKEICHQSVVNSIETMQERRTHLNRQ